MQEEFKVGDRVEIIVEYYDYKIGMKGTINDPDGFAATWLVVFDGIDYKDSCFKDTIVLSEHMKKIKE